MSNKNTMIDNLIYDLYLERRIREYCLTKLESKVNNIRDLWSKYEIELRKQALENSDVITREEAYKEFLNKKDVSEQKGGSKLLSESVSVGSILKRKRLDIYVKVVRKDEHYIYLSYYDIETKQTSQEIMRHEKWMIDAGYEKYLSPLPNTYLGASKSSKRKTRRMKKKNKRKNRRKTMKKHRN
tara:strand:+ start:407 stop:958 length:552 start_codon:yes stop_codon:yes gene_type:complete